MIVFQKSREGEGAIMTRDGTGEKEQFEKRGKS